MQNITSYYKSKFNLDPYLPKWSFYGDSVTDGSNASPLTLGYAYLVSAHFGFDCNNKAVGGTNVTDFLSSGVPIDPPIQNDEKLFFCWGLNYFNCTYQEYEDGLQEFIDRCVTAGWSKSNMVDITGLYCTDGGGFVATTYQSDVIPRSQAVATVNNILQINLNGTPVDMNGDNLHPSTTGHSSYAVSIIALL